MSEQESATAATADDQTTAAPELTFERNEVAQFDADDDQAGRVIGKMLSLFFLYTVIVMAGVAWWTYLSTLE